MDMYCTRLNIYRHEYVNVRENAQYIGTWVHDNKITIGCDVQ